MVAAGLDLRALWLSQTIGLSDLFLFFIYAEIIGMVGAFLRKQANTCHFTDNHSYHRTLQNHNRSGKRG